MNAIQLNMNFCVSINNVHDWAARINKHQSVNVPDSHRRSKETIWFWFYFLFFQLINKCDMRDRNDKAVIQTHEPFQRCTHIQNRVKWNSVHCPSIGCRFRMCQKTRFIVNTCKCMSDINIGVINAYLWVIDNGTLLAAKYTAIQHKQVNLGDEHFQR